MKWSEYGYEIPVGMYNANGAVLESKVYIGGRILNTGSTSSSKLLIYDFTEDLWDILDTPTQWYALTTYHSQLVLVGGVDPYTYAERVTNKLWVLEEQDNWNQSLPPMITKRYQASAVGAGDHLIVAGGCAGSVVGTLDVVEVYDGHQWMQVQSLPKACSSMKSALLEGNWYLAGGMGQGRKVYYTSLELLITSSGETEQTSVWEELFDAPLEWSTLAVFRNQLIAVGGGNYYSSAIYMYSSTSYWVHVGDLPVTYSSTCTLVLPTGELLVVGTKSGQSSCSFRAKIGVTSFPDGHFNMSALDRLEKVAGISIFNKLASSFLELASALQFNKSTVDSFRKENNPVEGSKAMFKAWFSGKSSLPPTWKVLLEKLQATHMEELAQEIDRVFCDVSVTSPSLSLVSDSKKEEGLALDSSAIEKKEQQTKPDYRDVAVQYSLDCCDMAVQSREVAVQTHETITPEISDSIHGVEVIGKTKLTVPAKGVSFEWRGYGLKLHVPRGSLPPGIEECKINIRASLSGQFQLPDDSAFLSPVFWISVPCKFSKPVTLEIQHCALREDEAVLSDLNFVSAKCSQRDLPYKFTQVDGGVFTTHSSYGSIQLSHFSGNAVTGRKSTPRSYCAHLYHTMKQMYDWRYYFIITQDLDVKNTVVREHYDHFAKKEATLRVRFGRSEITLGIPEDGLVTKDGWKITPFSHPTISRKDADQFEPGQWIPECQLIVQWEKKDQRPVQLMHKVNLIGAKAPYNFIHLTLNPEWEGVVKHPSTFSSESVEYCMGGDMPDQGLHSKYTAGLDSEPELSDLMNEVAAKIPSKWRDVGLQLGLDQGVLEGIALISPGDINHCYMNVFARWKNQNSTICPYTWSTVVRALRAPAVGEWKQADKIKNKLTGYAPVSIGID